MAVAPFVVREVARAWATVGVHIGRGLGRADLVDQLRAWHASTAADGAFSWFGPVGALLAVAALPIAVVEVRRRRLTRTAIVLAAAPLVAIALLSLIVSYQRYQGRYFISAFALCAATFGGYALTRRWLGTAVVGVATVTTLLTLVNAMGKPTGITVLGENASDSVWSMPRWVQQGILRSTPAERDEVQSMRFVEEHVPSDASLGIALVGNSFAEPYFGGHLTRRLTIVDDGDTLPRGVEWIVASPGRTLVGCRDSWTRERLGAYGWSVWRRIAPDTCSSPGRLGLRSSQLHDRTRAERDGSDERRRHVPGGMEQDREGQRRILVDADETERGDAEPFVGADVSRRRRHRRAEIEHRGHEQRVREREIEVERPRDEECGDGPHRPRREAEGQTHQELLPLERLGEPLDRVAREPAEETTLTPAPLSPSDVPAR